MACDTGLAADILAYWRAVEMFEPYGIPALPKSGAAMSRKPGTECVERIQLTAEVLIPPLPWQAEHSRADEQPAAGTYGSEWRHTVYGGIFSYADVRASYRHVLGYPEAPDYGGGREDVVGAAFAFVVDKDGRLIEGTEAFSPCAWATGRLHKPGPGDPAWLEGFDEVTHECRKALRRATGLTQEPGGPNEGRIVRAPDVLSLAWRLTTMLGLPSGIARPTEMRIVSEPVYRRKDGTLPKAEPPLLGSPIAPDIQRVRDAVATPGGIGLALASYLSGPLRPAGRTDVTRDRAALLAAVRPVRFPPARWPAASDRPPVISQQFAVNTILDEAGERSGLFSVNGPPGTGKSTLVRDLIAAIIVRRAEALAALADPMDGFTARHTWTTSDGDRHSVWQPRADLTGFEIVLASSSNAAAEIVTRDLSARNAIADEWQDQAEYFRAQAAELLGEPAWGMVAASLGGAEKCELPDVLHGYERDEPPSAQWTEAVERFVAARDRSVKMAAEREAAAEALRSPIGETEIRVVRKAVREADAELARAMGEARDAAAAAAECEDAERAVRHGQDHHDATRPRGLRGVFDTVHGSAKLKAWQTRSEELARQAGDAAARTAVARAVADGAHQRERAARQRSDDAQRAADRLTSRRERQQETLAQAVAEWGAAVPVNWLDLPPEEQERSAPWSDEAWLRVRTEVFLAASSLHQAFITSTAARFLPNIGHVFASLSRDPAAPPGGEAAAAAWQTLFLLVPVISTTFAACGRMFETLERDALGWLFVDEAGQALPQAVVGALWRSRRAVIIGDPLQLTPVSRVPGELQGMLRETYGVSVEWQPSAVSAQVLADRRNRWGTTLRGSSSAADEDVWVGAPLRVHRRCEEPMFGISNTIAYDGLLVCGTRQVTFPGGAYPEYPDSSWIDVPVRPVSGGGDAADGMWVPAAGDALVGVMHRLHAHNGVSLGQVHVLSPFREVAERCRALVLEEFGTAIADSLAATGAESDTAAVSDFIDAQVGTVDTMRGKESDVVVFVLGTDPSPSKGARDWAGHPVNRLNVAISRARRRLFVIGSHDEWTAAPNFGVLAARLPRHEWAPRPW